MERYGPSTHCPYLPSNQRRQNLQTSHETAVPENYSPIARASSSNLHDHADVQQNAALAEASIRGSPSSPSTAPSSIPSHGRTSSSIPAGGQKEKCEKPTRMQILEEQESSGIAIATFRQGGKASTRLLSPGYGSSYNARLSPPHYQIQVVLPANQASSASSSSPSPSSMRISPSKWDEAERWLTSRGERFSSRSSYGSHKSSPPPVPTSRPSSSSSSLMAIQVSEEDMEALKQAEVRRLVMDSPSSMPTSSGLGTDPIIRSGSGTDSPSSSSSSEEVVNERRNAKCVDKGAVMAIRSPRHLHRVKESRHDGSINLISGVFSPGHVARSSPNHDNSHHHHPHCATQNCHDGSINTISGNSVSGNLAESSPRHHHHHHHHARVVNGTSTNFDSNGLNTLDECTVMVKEEVDKCNTMVKEEISPHYANYIRCMKIARENRKASSSNVFQQGKHGILAHMSPPFNNNRASSRCNSQYWSATSSSAKPSSPALPMARHNSPEYASASSTIYQTCYSSSSTSSSAPLRADAIRLANYQLAKLVLSRRSTPLHYKLYGNGKGKYYGDGDDDDDNEEESEIKCQSSSAWPNMVLNRSTSYWSSREEEEEEAERRLRDVDALTPEEENLMRANVAKARACAWEEIQRSKCLQRSKRKEDEIEAWEKRKKDKAQFDLKKLEEKLERIRKQETEKILNNLATTQKCAEEMKAIAKVKQLQEMEKLRHRVHRLYESSESSSGRLGCVHHLRQPHSCNCLFFTRK